MYKMGYNKNYVKMKNMVKKLRSWNYLTAKFKRFGKKRIGLVVLGLAVILSGVGLFLAKNHSRNLASQVTASQSLITEEDEKHPADDQLEMLLAESQTINQSDLAEADESGETVGQNDNVQISETKNESVKKSGNLVPVRKVDSEEVIDPKVRIKCSMKAKKGSRDSRAIISWDCKHHVGWSCDLRVQTTNKPYEKVILPKSSQEVKVMTGHTDLVPYCEQNGCPTYEVEVPGYTYYWLICKSSDGRKKNFDGLYTFEED